MKTLIGVVGTALLAGTVACSQYTSATGPNTFRGCLQGDAAKGYAWLSRTVDGSGADTKGQTMTYKVVPAGSDIDLANMVNKTVEIGGSVSTEKSDTGSMPAPVTDTVRGTGGSGSAGQPGVNTAFYFANGSLAARSMRKLEPTYADRFAPDRNDPGK